MIAAIRTIARDGSYHVGGVGVLLDSEITVLAEIYVEIVVHIKLLWHTYGD